jgi:hypothetical protein
MVTNMAEGAESGNKMVFLSLAGMYPILLFVLFLTSSTMGEMVPFSPAAFMQPYSGPYATISLVLAFLALADVFVYYFMFYKKYLDEPKSHLLLLVYPEAIALFGFIIGFLNSNPWSALPLFAVAFSIYAYVYMRISAKAA